MSAASSSAAAKAKAEARNTSVKAQAPKLIRNETVPLQAISIAEDSGWRETDEERCTELQAIILDGGWGATALKGPSLIADDGGKVQYPIEDGKAILFDGKHLVKVLQTLKEEKHLQCPKEELGDCLADPLEEIFINGLKMEVYQFTEYDKLRHECWQALAHEAESNKLLHTTLNQKAQLMKKYFIREGNDWAAAREAVLATMGAARLSTVNRWIIISKDLAAGVLAHLKQFKEVPQSFVVGNKFLVGKGEESRYRLSDEWAKCAFTWWDAQAGWLVPRMACSWRAAR